MTRIHQITDLHIPDPDSQADLDHVKPNIEKQLSFVSGNDSDLLVISGDLTMTDGSKTSCEWLRDQLPDSPDVLFVPGNHDNPSVMWEVFGEAQCVNRQFCFTRHMGGRKVLFVNTTTDYLPEDQIAFLVDEGSDEDTILFIHHPPDLISHGFMSVNQPLNNFDEVAEAIRQARITDVFCGHYHNEIDKDCDGFTLHLTPSPAFQIDLNKVEFTFQDFEPKVRVIDIDNGKVTTWLETV